MFGPLAHGLLFDKFDPDNPPRFEEGDIRADGSRFGPENLRRVRENLGPIKERFGATTEDLVRVALQFALARSEHGCVIPGFKNPAQVEASAAASGKPLSPEDVQFVRTQLQG